MDGPGLFSQAHPVCFFLPCRKGMGASLSGHLHLCPELPGQQCQFGFGQRVFDLLNREEIPGPGPAGEATRKQGREEPPSVVPGSEAVLERAA